MMKKIVGNVAAFVRAVMVGGMMLTVVDAVAATVEELRAKAAALVTVPASIDQNRSYVVAAYDKVGNPGLPVLISKERNR